MGKEQKGIKFNAETEIVQLVTGIARERDAELLETLSNTPRIKQLKKGVPELTSQLKLLGKDNDDVKRSIAKKFPEWSTWSAAEEAKSYSGFVENVLGSGSENNTRPFFTNEQLQAYNSLVTQYNEQTKDLPDISKYSFPSIHAGNNTTYYVVETIVKPIMSKQLEFPPQTQRSGSILSPTPGTVQPLSLPKTVPTRLQTAVAALHTQINGLDINSKSVDANVLADINSQIARIDNALESIDEHGYGIIAQMEEMKEEDYVGKTQNIQALTPNAIQSLQGALTDLESHLALKERAAANSQAIRTQKNRDNLAEMRVKKQVAPLAQPSEAAVPPAATTPLASAAAARPAAPTRPAAGQSSAEVSTAQQNAGNLPTSSSIYDPTQSRLENLTSLYNALLIRKNSQGQTLFNPDLKSFAAFRQDLESVCINPTMLADIKRDSATTTLQALNHAIEEEKEFETRRETLRNQFDAEPSNALNALNQLYNTLQNKIIAAEERPVDPRKKPSVFTLDELLEFNRSLSPVCDVQVKTRGLQSSKDALDALKTEISRCKSKIITQESDYAQPLSQKASRVFEESNSRSSSPLSTGSHSSSGYGSGPSPASSMDSLSTMETMAASMWKTAMKITPSGHKPGPNGKEDLYTLPTTTKSSQNSIAAWQGTAAKVLENVSITAPLYHALTASRIIAFQEPIQGERTNVLRDDLREAIDLCPAGSLTQYANEIKEVFPDLSNNAALSPAAPEAPALPTRSNAKSQAPQLPPPRTPPSTGAPAPITGGNQTQRNAAASSGAGDPNKAARPKRKWYNPLTWIRGRHSATAPISDNAPLREPSKAPQNAWETPPPTSHTPGGNLGANHSKGRN